MIVTALTDDSILEAAKLLRSGGTVVYPTETAYALGADPLQPDAVEKVFALKGRDEQKPMGLIAASREQVSEWCEISPEEVSLMDRHWPGPLSLVLRLKPRGAHEHETLTRLTAGRNTVSIRLSSNPCARTLAEILGNPIVATSANRSGMPNVFTVQEAKKQFAKPPQPDMLIDAGPLPEGPMSTVIRFENGLPIVLRKGAMTI